MDEALLERVRVVLVGTTHPGNIGAAARAMKTMGLRRLALVAPKRFPSAEATAMASGADDLLMAASVHETLASAIGDCALVLATSARARSIPWPTFTPRAAVGELLAAARGGEVALVFGREHSGLSNEELDQAHGMVRIPTAPEHASLNLAAAVQVLAYELRMALIAAGEGATDEGSADGDFFAESPPATQAEMAALVAHLERVLTGLGYLDPQRPRRLPRRLRRLVNRQRLDRAEVQILRGFLAAVEDRAGSHEA